MTEAEAEDRSYDYRITKTGGDVKLDIGDKLTELTEQVSMTAITRIIGEGLIRIGTHLMGGTVEGDEEDDDDY